MSVWTNIFGSIVVAPYGRTMPERRYILDTVLEHLPRVTGSERDMSTYVVDRENTTYLKACNEFGVSFKMIDGKSWHEESFEYVIVVDGDLRDRYKAETVREFSNWLNRLAKRVHISKIMVRIEQESLDEVTTFCDAEPYGEMYEPRMFEWEEFDPPYNKLNWCSHLVREKEPRALDD